MRGAAPGFRIFFACLVLGVAAIAGVESLSEAFLTGLAEQGRTLLGGDVVVHLVHRPAEAGGLAFLAGHGRVSQAQSMRGMAYALKNGVESRAPAGRAERRRRAPGRSSARVLRPAQDMRDALACEETASAARWRNRPCWTGCICGAAT